MVVSTRRATLGILAAAALVVTNNVAVFAADKPHSGIPEGESPRARMEEPKMRDTAPDKILRNAAEAYRSIVRGTHGEVPASVLSAAKCVAVFPNVVTAALVVGGTHGDGTVSCKTKSGKWSAPGFVDMSGGSFGAQLGGKSSDVVLFFQDDEAVSALKKGKFNLGADAGVTAGTYSAVAEMKQKGIIAYQRSEGAYAGASLTGTNVIKDDRAAESYYNKPIDFVEILEGTTTPAVTAAADEFVALLPRTV
jgi:lipid-binding SYLF domain-containing protein